MSQLKNFRAAGLGQMSSQLRSLQQLDSRKTKVIKMLLDVLSTPQHSAEHLSTPLSSDHEDQWIQSLLNPDAFIGKNDTPELVSRVGENSEDHPPEDKEELSSQDHSEVEHRRKSVYHNFQKHLIGALKRLIRVRRMELERRDYGGTAYKLLRVFQETTTANKKLLMVLFGFGGSIEKEVEELKKVFPYSREVLERQSLEEVAGAQALLRETFALKMKPITLEDLRVGCKITKIDHFYDYFRRFIGDLEKGHVTRRMRKNAK